MQMSRAAAEKMKNMIFPPSTRIDPNVPSNFFHVCIIRFYLSELRNSRRIGPRSASKSEVYSVNLQCKLILAVGFARFSSRNCRRLTLSTRGDLRRRKSAAACDEDKCHDHEHDDHSIRGLQTEAIRE